MDIELNPLVLRTLLLLSITVPLINHCIHIHMTCIKEFPVSKTYTGLSCSSDSKRCCLLNYHILTVPEGLPCP